MLARASLAALFGFLLPRGVRLAPLKPRSCLLCGESYGWSPTAGGLIAKRPVPVAAPDATFVTRHVSFADDRARRWVSRSSTM